MKNKITVSCASVNQTPLDWERNVYNIISCIKEAKEHGSAIVVLPELCITGYGCEDAFFMPNTIDKSLESLNEIRKTCAELCIFSIVGLPIEFNGSLYNTACLIPPSLPDCLHMVPKQNLCSNGVHYESRWFKPWTSNEVFNLENHLGIPINIGKQTFTINNINFGIEICEDAWVYNRPGIELAQNNVDVICNISASHFSFNKHITRKTLVENSSRELNVAYLYSNLVGNEAGRVIYDGDCIIANNGKVIHRSELLNFNNTQVITATVDVFQNKINKLQNQNKNKIYKFLLNSKYYLNDKIVNNSYVEKEYTLEHQFERAVSLGLWDYMLKTKSKGFVLSLSGGVDSSVVAYLVNKMIDNAIDDLGDYAFDVLKENNIINDCNNIGKQLLTCIYQATDNSSKQTEKIASDFSEYIGSSFSSVNINCICNIYTSLSESITGQKINWNNADIALQNIQARSRGVLVWMIANIKNALLLSTSNRSEAAVGYTTMDGDTCGGLSPICGVSKEFLISYLNKKSETEPIFKNLLSVKPTAELRPKEFNQTDEDDLMPYDILNKIEVMVVKNKMAPKDVINDLNIEGVERAEEYTKKFFKLFSQNQWKRERYAPAFHLDDESLDPKTFYRFPILNSGFKSETNK